MPWGGSLQRMLDGEKESMIRKFSTEQVFRKKLLPILKFEFITELVTAFDRSEKNKSECLRLESFFSRVQYL
jgi:hypothetical protein